MRVSAGRELRTLRLPGTAGVLMCVAAAVTSMLWHPPGAADCDDVTGTPRRAARSSNGNSQLLIGRAKWLSELNSLCDQ